MSNQNNSQVQIANANLNQIHAIGEYGVNEIMAMKETIGKDLSIPQFNLFMYDCMQLGLKPRLKHAFPILYGGKMDFRISFEGYHSMAQKSDGYAGLYMEYVGENEAEDFRIETDEEGFPAKLTHPKRSPRGKVVGAYAIARRESRKNVIVFVDASEVEKYVKKNGQFWKLDNGNIDPDMIKKFAGIRAIKMQYDVAAVADEMTEEMNAIPSYQPQERKDITHEASHSEPQHTEQPNPPAEPGQPQNDDGKIAKLKADMKLRFMKLGISDKEAKAQFLADNGKFKDPTAPTISELTAVLRKMDLLIEQQNAQEDPLLGDPLV